MHRKKIASSFVYIRTMQIGSRNVLYENKLIRITNYTHAVAVNESEQCGCSVN